MKKFLLLTLASIALAGCAVVPMEGRTVAYVSVPAPVAYVSVARPVVVAQPYRYGYARYLGGPQYRHWR